MVIRNLDQFLKVDDENQTAYLDLPNNGYWWYWYGNTIEANATYLRLLTKVDPQNEKAARPRQVPAQQPQARHVLEQHPRHGATASNRWRGISSPAARIGRT